MTHRGEDTEKRLRERERERERGGERNGRICVRKYY